MYSDVLYTILFGHIGPLPNGVRKILRCPGQSRIRELYVYTLSRTPPVQTLPLHLHQHSQQHKTALQPHQNTSNIAATSWQCPYCATLLLPRQHFFVSVLKRHCCLYNHFVLKRHCCLATFFVLKRHCCLYNHYFWKSHFCLDSPLCFETPCCLDSQFVLKRHCCLDSHFVLKCHAALIASLF